MAFSTNIAYWMLRICKKKANPLDTSFSKEEFSCPLNSLSIPSISGGHSVNVCVVVGNDFCLGFTQIMVILQKCCTYFQMYMKVLVLFSIPEDTSSVCSNQIWI